MRIRRIVPIITSERLEASREFYTEIIGLSTQMDLGWIIRFGSPSDPTAQINVMREDASAPVNPAVTIEVADVDTVHARAEARGAEIVYPLTDEPWGARRFFVRDGSIINVMTHT